MGAGKVSRRLAAILAADVAGYSRLMGADEAGTLERLKAHRHELIDPEVEQRGGRVVKLMGDGALVEFPSVVDAVDCAVAVQRGMAGRNAGVGADQRIEFRIGVNLGEVIVDGDDIYGGGVNIAARLEGLAEPGGICVSAKVHGEVAGKVDAGFEDMGAQSVKNIAEPVRVYRVTPDQPATTSRPLPPTDKSSIAVLPFDNMSGDPEQEYFSDGITEDIITELSRFSELLVIARNSSFSYKGKSVKVQEISRDLGVSYVVEGSVRKAGNRVRVTAQLIELATASHIWADRWDRELEDIFDVQDEITSAIVSVLPSRLRGALTETARRKPTENLTAYDYYLRGRWVFTQSMGEDPAALDLLAKAVEIDPRYAHAHALMAMVYAYSVYALHPMYDNPIPLARENIERALAVGESDPLVHALAGDVYIILGEHELSTSHAERAVAINPNDIWVRHAYGFNLAYCGKPDEGVKWLVDTLRLDPYPPDFLLEIVAECHYLLGDYEALIDIYMKWRNPPLHMFTQLAAAYAQLGRMDEARDAYETYERLRPTDADFAYYLAAHIRLRKHQEDADHWVEGYRKAGFEV